MARLAIYVTNSLKIIQFLRSYVYLYNINKILLLVKCANQFSVICSPATKENKHKNLIFSVPKFLAA